MNLNEKVVIFNYAAPAGRIDFLDGFHIEEVVRR
ncbi:unknown protein [Parachlamydia acanthamoebae UV-7]|uniref:Uncharacterized protein n=1 Tax=Parachlamydia acanthamoebae (strain UV7) TaxID=765952 RepID=F8L0P6_PARAV|nr:unknown protein [Parachlamydia acanthamoebae UV-7]